MYASNDNYVAIEVNIDGVNTSAPMNLDAITAYVTEKYKDQPLQYFNINRRIKIVHLKTGDIKVAKLIVEF